MVDEIDVSKTVQNMREAAVPFYDLEVGYSEGAILLKIPFTIPVSDPMLPQLVEAIEIDKKLVKAGAGLSAPKFSGTAHILFTPEFREGNNGD